jgi:hypothetical protein
MVDLHIYEIGEVDMRRRIQAKPRIYSLGKLCAAELVDTQCIFPAPFVSALFRKRTEPRHLHERCLAFPRVIALL